MHFPVALHCRHPLLVLLDWLLLNLLPRRMYWAPTRHYLDRSQHQGVPLANHRHQGLPLDNSHHQSEPLANHRHQGLPSDSNHHQSEPLANNPHQRDQSEPLANNHHQRVHQALHSLLLVRLVRYLSVGLKLALHPARRSPIPVPVSQQRRRDSVWARWTSSR